MGIAITGLTRSTCPSCKYVMFGFVHSSYEGQEVLCINCKRWCIFSVGKHSCKWSPLPWDAKAPDNGANSCDAKAWADAVEEVNNL